MNSGLEDAGTGVCWFVGANFSGDDQTQRFINDGIWENGYQDRYINLVKSIQPGDRIAIKSSYTRKNDLPFDNRGQSVSVMAIKAIGNVVENYSDGWNVKVDWTPIEPPLEWYFYTHRGTIWKVAPGDWRADALIEFVFNNVPQDLTRFRNAPYWRERFGDPVTKQRFKWTSFYEAFADKLLGFKNKRSELVAGIHNITGHVEGLSYPQDQYPDGTIGPLRDICPFTTIGTFNRNISDSNRRIIAGELAKLLGVNVPVPETFEGIPILNNQKSWFFRKEYKRQPDDIDALWEIFAEALRFAESDDIDARSSFIKAYDNASKRFNVGWNLTMGLYWIRPWIYLTLDGQSQKYISEKLQIEIGLNGPKGRCSGDDYLTVLETLEARFQEETYPVHSFPELSLASWLYNNSEADAIVDEPNMSEEETELQPESQVMYAPLDTYTIDDILADGCFTERDKLKMLLERLRTKKNLILQGPPGTGKTWLAKRLAYALIGERNESRVRAVQFHPNLTYEDFVRGWRPTGEGKLSLVDGPFMEVIKSALKEPTVIHVIVIEEINRGNPAQIFGEMLTLMEVDKRTPTEALEVCHSRVPGERIFIPANLYIIGTMNIADRSLALVDLALRRRFAFVDLEPEFGKTWSDWVRDKCGIEATILDEIEKRILALNEEIAADASLGPQFRIGHSFVTPPFKIPITEVREWFVQVVDTEIGPLLEEYWFDAIDKARKAKERLKEGF